MNAAAKLKKVDRKEVYDRVVELIRQSPNGQAEISSSDLAHQFHVEPPTMDHHLKKLVSEGLLRTSSQRGRYNRKIYLLPDGSRDVVTHVQTGSSESSAARRWLEERRRQAASEMPGANVTEIETKRKPVEEKKVPDPVPETPASPATETPSFVPPIEQEQKQEVKIEVKELTLDDRIQDFLARSQSVP